jgi:hypothetical protein
LQFSAPVLIFFPADEFANAPALRKDKRAMDEKIVIFGQDL